MPKTEKTIDGFAVRTSRDSLSVSKSSPKKHTPKNLKKSARKPKSAAPSRSLSGIKPVKSTSATSKKSSPALSPKKKPTTPLSETQPTSSAEDFTAPVKAFTSPADPAEEDLYSDVPLPEPDLASASDSDDFSSDRSTQDSYINSLSDLESTVAETDQEETEDDLEISELTPREAREMRKKSKSDLKAEERAGKKSAKLAEKAEKAEKKKSPLKTFFKIFFLLLLLTLIGGGVYVVLHLSDIVKKITGGNDNLWSAGTALLKETYEPLKSDVNGRTNILVFGTSGYTMEGDSGDGYTHDGADLTDSIMVVSLDQEKGDIAMVSLPRDLRAGYTCTATGKINEVYWCANMNGDDELAGASALQDKIKEILGVETQYYVHLNWGALVSVVDSLGGIQVTLDEDIADYGWTDAVYSAGVEYTLDGEDALALARARHGTENGDFTRGNSQQKILIAIKNKVVEKGLDFTALSGILNALGDNLRSNLSVSDLKTGAHLLEISDLSQVRQVPLVSEDSYYMTTTSLNGISYVVPSAGVDNYSVLKQYISDMFNADPLAREAAKIEVLNGAGVAGLASSERTKLEAEGFRVQDIGDAPEAPEDAPYPAATIFDASEGKKPTTLSALEDFYGVSAQPESSLPAGVSGYGVDFIIILGSSSENVQTE